jgi:hypothetical protein
MIREIGFCRQKRRKKAGKLKEQTWNQGTLTEGDGSVQLTSWY